MPTPQERHKPPPRVTKLKDTCDSCARSKVKCDRGRPHCQRCARHGIVCNYSPAQRVGRSRTTSGNRMTWSFNLDGDDLSNRHTSVAHPEETENDQADGLALAEADFPADTDFNMASFSPIYPHHVGRQVTGPEARGSDGGIQSKLSNKARGTYQLGSLSSLALPSTASQQTVFDWNGQIDGFLNMPTPCSMTPEPFPSSPDKSMYTNVFLAEEGTGSLSPECPRARDCTKLALSTFESLHVPVAGCCMLPSSFEHSAKGPGMDTIFKSNKRAIENIFTILSCPCSSNEPTTLLLALICSQVIDAYQRISLSQQSSTPVQTPSGEFPDGNNNLALTGDSKSIDGDLGMPVAIGCYMLDPDMKWKMVSSVLLCELNRVGKAVERVTGSSSRRSNTESSSELHSTLRPFLMAKLRATFRTVRNNLADL